MTFTVSLEYTRLPLSRASVQALRNIEHYDYVLCTSKHALKFFKDELRQHGFAALPLERFIIVGPRFDLLTYPIDGTRLLFPRSVLAPRDILDSLRARGAIVRTIPLYTVHVPSLTATERSKLLNAKIDSINFRSPSAVHGLLKQFRGEARKAVLEIPATCIGDTTAEAARRAGFRRVSIGVL